MRIIREYSTYAKRCVLRSDGYLSNLTYFATLYESALEDFPNLKPNAVEVVHFGGDRYRGTFGIQFSWLEGEVPGHYSRMERLELTL